MFIDLLIRDLNEIMIWCEKYVYKNLIIYVYFCIGEFIMIVYNNGDGGWGCINYCSL